VLGELKEDGELVLLRVTEHELAEGLGAIRDRLILADRVGHERLEGVRVDPAPDGGHDEQSQEERQPQEHLIRRKLGDPDRTPQKRQDDDDPSEARRHEQDRGYDREDGQRDKELERKGELTAAGADLPVADLNRHAWDTLRAATGDREEREAEEGDAT